MRFHKHEFIDRVQGRRAKRIVYAIVLVTLIPAIILTFTMVRENTFEQRIRNFVQKEMELPGTTVVTCQPDYDTRSFSIVLIGDDVDSATIARKRERMDAYKLKGVTMNVVQANANTLSNELQRLKVSNTDASRRSESLLTKQSQQLRETEIQLKSYTETETLAPSVLSELQILFPQVQSVVIAKGQYASADTTHQQTIVVVKTAPMQNKHTVSPHLSKTSIDQLTQWLKQRTSIHTLRIVYE